MVSYVIDDLHWKRNKAIFIVGALIFILVFQVLSFGTLSNITILNYSLFDFIGMVTDNILLPIGGVLMCITSAGSGSRVFIAEIQEGGVKFKPRRRGCGVSAP